MWRIGKPAPGQNFGPLRRVLAHAAMLLVFWLLLMFVVIPWDTEGQYPADSFGLIEGQRAYVAVVRESRPNLVAALRGLNMVHASYIQEETDGRRRVRFGNIEMHFELDGSFRSIRIIH